MLRTKPFHKNVSAPKTIRWRRPDGLPDEGWVDCFVVPDGERINAGHGGLDVPDGAYRIYASDGAIADIDEDIYGGAKISRTWVYPLPRGFHFEVAGYVPR